MSNPSADPEAPLYAVSPTPKVSTGIRGLDPLPEGGWG